MQLARLLLVLACTLAATGCLRGPAPVERPVTTAPPVELPPVQPPVEPVKPKPVDEPGWYLPRSSWAVGSIDLSATEPMATPYRITVHHSGEPGDHRQEPRELLRTFERNHKQQRGWAAIGYHFIIARDGKVYEGRPLKYQGAHAGGDNNIGNIGVCLIGDFDHTQVPKAQRDALIDTLDRLCRRYRITHSNVYGHRNFKTTDCPGRYLMRVVDDFRNGN